MLSIQIFQSIGKCTPKSTEAAAGGVNYRKRREDEDEEDDIDLDQIEAEYNETLMAVASESEKFRSSNYISPVMGLK